MSMSCGTQGNWPTRCTRSRVLPRTSCASATSASTGPDAVPRRLAGLCFGSLAALQLLPSSAEAAGPNEPNTTITQMVFFDVGLSDRALKPAAERTIGDRSIIPNDAKPIGRIVLGLYGDLVPVTVHNFVEAVRSGAYDGTTFSRILAGEYIQAGKQGTHRLGEVEAPAGLQANPELSSAGAFQLGHNRPGTVSLSLAENDEDPSIRSRSGYHATEFLITTGPGPAPRLDGVNLVFGRVLEGIDTVAAIARVPTFTPSDNARSLNILAQALGDDRAANVRRKYGRPLKAVVILGSGLLSSAGGAASGAAAALSAAA